MQQVLLTLHCGARLAMQLKVVAIDTGIAKHCYNDGLACETFTPMACRMLATM